MSAKGRKKAATGKAVEKPDSEFFPTPAWTVLRLLDHVALPFGWWLEPSAGDGAIIRAVKSARPEGTHFCAVELRNTGPRLLAAGASDVVIGDFLDHTMVELLEDRQPGGALFDVCIGNPPFSLAAPFVLQALECSEIVVMLLRLNFLGSSSNRRHLFESAGMPDVYVLPERPSFTGEGTDATEYGWMVWKRDGSQEGKVRILWDKAQANLFEETP